MVVDETVTNLPDRCEPPSIVVDSGETPHISWVSFTPYRGHYGRRDGAWGAVWAAGYKWGKGPLCHLAKAPVARIVSEFRLLPLTLLLLVRLGAK